MSPKEHGSTRVGALACLALLAAAVFPVQPAQAITVNSLAIIGKNDDSGIDARIPRSVRRALTRTFRFKSYTLHSTARATVALREQVRLSLPGRYALLVQPLRIRGRGNMRRILLQVEIVKGDQRIAGAAVWLRPGRYWLLGGPAVDGGALIVALAVAE